jgi:hypothetical protein
MIGRRFNMKAHSVYLVYPCKTKVATLNGTRNNMITWSNRERKKERNKERKKEREKERKTFVYFSVCYNNLKGMSPFTK